MKRSIWGAAALLSLAALLYFELSVVPSALEVQADGYYGELYGPVSSLRLPVSGTLLFAALACAACSIRAGRAT